MLVLMTSMAVYADIHRSHGYHPFGELHYPADFRHFDYVNPDAPKGGTLRLFAQGTFDSLNPYILKGIGTNKVPGLQMYTFTDMADSLMMGAQDNNPLGDEAGAAYGLIADWIEYPDDRSWCTFHIRQQARFHDGHPIRADDVVYTVNLLREQGDPEYALKLSDVQKVEALDPQRVKFTFSRPGRDLPLVVGALPILPRHYWQKHDFSSADLTPPLSSGPYRVARVEAGKKLVLERVRDYWARDLPVNKGRYNFDRVEFQFYRDADVGFEAFKTGAYDVNYDYSSKHWKTAYDFPAMRDGRVKRAEIPHQMPRPTQAFFFNTRRPPFDDLRVRKAMNLLFDFEWTNKQLFSGAYTRTGSWFVNSRYRAPALPSEAERQLLAPLKSELPADLLSADISQPVNDGSGQIRDRLRQALVLLREAGWHLKDQTLVNAQGQPLRFTVLNYHNPGIYRILAPWFRNMKRLGIEAEYREVDPSAYKQRLDHFDYDMVLFVLPMRAYPGPELNDYFGSGSAKITGSHNLAGINDPAVDALIHTALSTDNEQTYVAALQALDRLLRYQHYGVLNYYISYHRLAWWDKFGRPPEPLPYALGLDTWWMKKQ
ncbi:oligopeptide ABC transporter periplasmic peptide-binding protein [Alcanivorax hongdengensis A-11-3]|uniref:Oligopeptide ABC transporter periplasmic peptide-binding protein n=1 Tax=Alcanivorax hongdengensis A-11-3 TaxID=1177179 RepID=L0WDM8_9GAMM|nr:extracellular solute-binding protein [Alcanivorax hongdengensis]EKF74898.1 oligopeptide ABC transporter periplasmic peptide-binding protein [Alcanivorax hongdengensis A-11-3]